MRANIPNTVCLIIPPSVFLLDERVFLTLGILKIAAVLESAGVKVEMLDLSGVKNFTDVAKDHARVSEAVHFGITATTPHLPSAVEIAKAIRCVCPYAIIILGGPHVTLVNASYKRERKLGICGRAVGAMHQLTTHFDVLVAGDGEEAIFCALSSEAQGVIDADDLKSKLFLSDARLSELPFPARHLVDIDSYSYFVDEERALSLIAQLGCPFECGFCGGRQSPSLRRVRMRTNENVVAEMVGMYETYGVKGFMLYDDELNVNLRMVELMNLIRRAQEARGVQWHLRGFVKAQLFTDEQARVLHNAGFRWILVGFESGSSRILDNINKRATQDSNTHCMEIARRHGLKVKALMSIGHPGESCETIDETRDWLVSVRPDDFDITIITEYPGTPYYDYAVPHPSQFGVWVYTYEKTGDKLYSCDVDFTRCADYYKGVPGEYTSHVWTDYITREVLVQMRDDLENRVRMELQLPSNPERVSLPYEHSMGQNSGLPSYILRTSL